jgi:hypothetical protein
MFSTHDLENMRTTQENHMMDLCVFQACVQTRSTTGALVETWPVDSDASVCGLDMRPGFERDGVEMVVLNYDATLRLPITSTPNAKDRIKITKRFNEVLAVPLVFNIVGPIQRGPSGIRLLLKRIET